MPVYAWCHQRVRIYFVRGAVVYVLGDLVRWRIFSGMLLDHYGNYNVAFATNGSLQVFGGLLILLLVILGNNTAADDTTLVCKNDATKTLKCVSKDEEPRATIQRDTAEIAVWSFVCQSTQDINVYQLINLYTIWYLFIIILNDLKTPQIGVPFTTYHED